MAESQKEFLHLIRDFSSQKSHGDRRVSDLKKHMLHLTSSLDSANSDLECAKQSRETAEQELKGTQVHLAMTDASIQSLESRMSNLQDEISRVGSELTALKNEEDTNRDDFIRKMLEMNKIIREFQAQGTANLLSGAPNSENNTDQMENEIQRVNDQIHIMETEYEKDINNQNAVNSELENLRQKITVMEVIVEESKYIQDLAGYPLNIIFFIIIKLLLVIKSSLTKNKLTGNLQRESSVLEEELHKKHSCPVCGINNMPTQ